jgi:hypothetical protein
MESVPTTGAAVKPGRRTSTAIYRAMDRNAWSAVATIPPLSEAEAIKAARLLYRQFLWRVQFERRGRPVPRGGGKVEVKVTSGHRYNDMRRGVIYVNPPRGWDALVHELSHDFHRRLRPRDPGHGDNHRALEREMIEHVVKSGWLDGKLIPKPRAPRPARPVAPKPDPLIAEHDKAVARVKAWKTRLRRAKTGLASAQKAELKLRRKRQRIVRFTLD